MIWPEDTPKWVYEAISKVEEEVEAKVAKSKSADDAMKASGAFELWLGIKSEIELEAQKQLSAIKRVTAAFNERAQ